MESTISSTAFADSKPHYEWLDGLRGVAALLVLWYHINEGYGFAKSVNGVSDGLVEHFNHGYLAVDFFFILSGFVIGYAYDDRWKNGFTMRQFFNRRLIRLHPMVLMGAVVGLVFFYLQGGVRWDGAHVSASLSMMALLLAMCMIPVVPGSSWDIRGNGEMFPLNGPAWSLFFEYIGNILYALFIHRLPTRVLGLVALVTGGILVWFNAADVSGYGSFGVGWTLEAMNFWGGMLRMLFPYTMGMFLSRIFRPVKIRGAFWICSALLLALFAVPYIQPMGGLSLNGLYESACIVVIFPILVWVGASEKTSDGCSLRLCQFLGDISYPLYMVHYPVMYLFYSWLITHKVYTFSETWPESLGAMVLSIVIAVLCLRYFDKPVRRKLAKKAIRK